jgi:hypothetical protein
LLTFAHARIILNSMQRFQSVQQSFNVIYIQTRGKVTDLADICACAGDPELDAPVSATPARDLYLAKWRGH